MKKFFEGIQFIGQSISLSARIIPSMVSPLVYLAVILALLLIFQVSPVRACTEPGCTFDSNVQDTNDGKAGDIFTYCGEKGNNSLGTWVNPKDVPELKGDKGEKGDTGANGRDGLDGAKGDKGDNGDTGAAGKDGLNGLDGQDGRDGLNGSDGAKGDTGPAGKDGLDGVKGDQGDPGKAGNDGADGAVGPQGAKGTDGKTPVKNVDYKDGDQGAKGDTGLTGPQGRGLKDRYEIVGELRVLDTKHTTWSLQAGRDVNNDNNIFQGRLTIKLGKSYEERRIEELEKKISTLVPDGSETTVIKNEKGEVISMSIHDSSYGGSITKKF